MNKKTEIRVDWGQGLVGHVAQSGVTLNIPDVYRDERFNQEVDNMTGYRTRSMLCQPIKEAGGSGEVIGVAQVINKANDGVFNSNDEIVFEKYLQFCGIGLKNAQLYERSQLEVKRNQVTLRSYYTSSPTAQFHPPSTLPLQDRRCCCLFVY